MIEYKATNALRTISWFLFGDADWWYYVAQLFNREPAAKEQPE